MIEKCLMGVVAVWCLAGSLFAGQNAAPSSHLVFDDNFGKILTYHIELHLGCYSFDPVVGIHIDHHNRIHHNRIHLDHGVVVVSLSLLLWFEA